MGPRNWIGIVLGFTAAAVLLIVQGNDALFAVLMAGGLLLITILVLVPLLLWVGRRQVAEMRLRGDLLELEMLSPFGRGRLVDVPLAEVTDWSISRFWPTLRFRSGSATFRLPLQGALLDRAALAQIAPQIRQTVR